VKKFNIISLGCPKNLVDSEEISYKISKLGYELTLSENSDISIINTCAFLKSAVRESEKIIENQIKFKKEGKIKKIIVCGCLVEREKEKLLKKYPEIDIIIGINSIHKLENAIKNRESLILPTSDLYSQNRLRLTLKHSAYLKISDGCDNNCSYCLIPSIRGKLRSKTIEILIKEAIALADSGVKELNIIAQDTTSYGIDIYKKPALKDLLKKLIKIKKIKWIRLMYIYPDRIDRELLEIIKDSNICHYLEMPLQHISDNVLEKMNRISSEKIIREKIELIKKIIPDMSIRTTFIVGFPGESEKDFNKLINFVKDIKFNNLAVFKYSREKGTKAFNLNNQISSKIKNFRYKELLKTQAEVVDKINKDLIGKDFEILMDNENIGRAYFDAPDIDGYISFEDKKVPGTFLKAKIIEAKGYHRKAIN